MENNQNIDLITSRLMLAMGFKLSLMGATYIREAVKYIYKFPLGTKISYSGKVFPYIAANHDTSARNVERDIRTAILNCFDNGRMFVLNSICKCEAISTQYPPTVGELISAVVTLFKTLEMENEKACG